MTLSVFVDPHPTVSGGTIGFAFAGNKFVGSVDHDGTGVLYQTDLNGRNVRLFTPSVSSSPNQAEDGFFIAPGMKSDG